MKSIFENYNTQRDKLAISEYGRSVQNYVEYMQSRPDKAERTKLAYAIIEIMTKLNSDIKKQQNYQEVLWGHLQHIADFNLDVDSPFPLPTKAEAFKKPEHIGYPRTGIKFRFYGRNLQNMTESIATIADEGAKQELLNSLASFMFNSSRAWNDEQLSNAAIAEHIQTLSSGKLKLDADDFEVTEDPNAVPNIYNRKNQNQLQNKKYSNIKKKKKNFRRF